MYSYIVQYLQDRYQSTTHDVWRSWEFAGLNPLKSQCRLVESAILSVNPMNFP